LQCQDQPDNQKEGVPELIEMQEGFVGVAQGGWERIARALDFDEKRLQKTALQGEFAPREDACCRNSG